MIGEPPSLSGGRMFAYTPSVSGPLARSVGAPGAVAPVGGAPSVGVPGVVASLKGPTPAALAAATRNEYCWPFVRPVMLALLPLKVMVIGIGVKLVSRCLRQGCTQRSTQ